MSGIASHEIQAHIFPNLNITLVYQYILHLKDTLKVDAEDLGDKKWSLSKASMCYLQSWNGVNSLANIYASCHVLVISSFC